MENFRDMSLNKLLTRGPIHITRERGSKVGLYYRKTKTGVHTYKYMSVHSKFLPLYKTLYTTIR